MSCPVERGGTIMRATLATSALRRWEQAEPGYAFLPCPGVERGHYRQRPTGSSPLQLQHVSDRPLVDDVARAPGDQRLPEEFPERH